MKKFDTFLEYTIYLYIIILPIAPSKLKLGPVPFNGDVVLALIIFFYLIKIGLDRMSREKFIHGLKDFFTHSLGISMAIIISVMFFSVTYSMDRSLAFKESARFTTYIILYFIIKYEITGEWVKRNMIKIYFAVCFIIFAKGIYDYASALSVVGSAELINQLRTSSTLENANNLGAFALISLFPAFTLFIGEKQWKAKAVYGILAAMAAVNIVVSFSRSALLGIMGGFVLITILYSYKFIIMLAAAGGAALAIPATRLRIFQIADMTQNESRIKVWKTALYMIKDHLWLGVGNGNFYSQYGGYVKMHPELVDTYDSIQVLHPHNIILKMQSELGILGTAAFLGIIVSVFRDLAAYLKNESDDFFYRFYRGFLVSAVIFMMMNMIDNFFSAPKVIAFFWIFISIYQSLDYNRNCIFTERRS